MQPHVTQQIWEWKHFGMGGKLAGEEKKKKVNVLGFPNYKKHEKQNNKFVSENWGDPCIQTLLYHLSEQWKKRIIEL